MRIKEFSEKYHVDPRTIDYYSNVAKILPYKQSNKSNNYRDYDEESERAIKKILILRGIGLSIEEIKTALQDRDYFSMSRLDEHIKNLKTKRDEEIKRYDEWINFAETLKNSKLVPLDSVDSIKINIPVDILIQAIANAENTSDYLAEDECYQELYDAVLPFLFRISQNLNESPSSDKVQSIVTQYLTRLNKNPGLILSIVFKVQPLIHPNIFDELFKYQKEDEDITQFFSCVSELCSDWCAKMKSRERILDEKALKMTYKAEIEALETSYRELVDSNGETAVDLIVELLNGFVDEDFSLLLIGVAIGSDLNATKYAGIFDKQFGDGFYHFFRSAIQVYIDKMDIKFE